MLNLTVLLDAPRAKTSDNFLIRDVPGTSGRLDVVCRILISTFRTIPELAPNIQFNAILGGPPNPPLRLRAEHMTPNEVPESELACALLLKTALFRYRVAHMASDNRFPQFSISPQSFHETLEELIHLQSQLLYLVENGEPLMQVNIDFDRPIAVIVGDDQGLHPQHAKIVNAIPIRKVSIGTRSLLGSHVISLFLLELRRRMEKDCVQDNLK